MKTFGKLLLGSVLIGTFSLAQAADYFGGVTWGETSDNMQKTRTLNAQLNDPDLDGAINNSETWGARFGVTDQYTRLYVTYDYTSDTRHSYKLRQQNLLGSFDGQLPVGDYGTRLFGGVSLGLVSLEQDSKGFHRDRGVGVAGGLQAGIIQDLSHNVELEGGYRYLRTSADVRMAPHGGGSLGHADLHSSEQFYVGLNYLF